MRIIFASYIAILSLVLLTTACVANEIDFGFQDLKSKGAKSYLVLIGKIESIEYVVYSPIYRDVKSVTISTEKTVRSFLTKSQPKMKCAALHDNDMIAPFDYTALDKPLHLEVNERVLIYVGITEDSCRIYHISKITNATIHFPAWKKQEALEISESEIERTFSKQFDKVFDNERR